MYDENNIKVSEFWRSIFYVKFLEFFFEISDWDQQFLNT